MSLVPPNDSQVAEFAQAIDHRGWAVTPPIVAPAVVSALRAETAVLAKAGRGGARNLFELPGVRDLATHAGVRRLASSVLGQSCFAVRALFFDKTSNANWKVVWHQDLTIATAGREESSGFGPWTEKGGVPHTQPPVSVLESMLAVRVHLDACTVDNGPVRVIDRSHRGGRLSATDIDAIRAARPERACLVEEGGILAFRPLILHASAPASLPGHRRVIHLEFAASDLPAPLAWHWRIA